MFGYPKNLTQILFHKFYITEKKYVLCVCILSL